jgi:hypothetical protein
MHQTQVTAEGHWPLVDRPCFVLGVLYAGQMQYDHVADAVARCSKVRAKVKRWAAAAELLASEHPAQYAAQEKEQPGITELQVREGVRAMRSSTPC